MITTYGYFAVVFLIAIKSVGIPLPGETGFALGNKGRERLIRRYGHYIRLDEQKLKVGRYLFDRHGAKAVFFGRSVSILRTYAAFLAGANLKQRWRNPPGVPGFQKRPDVHPWA
jgi:membrane protein DedA with SNARE-associated domain